MPPTKFQLNPAYCLGGGVVLRFSRWPTWRPAWISERNQFSNSKLNVAPMPPIKFVLNLTGSGANVGSRFSRWLPDGHLGYQNGTVLAILNVYVAPMLPVKFRLNPTYTVWEMAFEEFQNGHHGGHLGYRNGMILAILNFCIALMLPIKFRINPTYSLGGYAV